MNSTICRIPDVDFLRHDSGVMPQPPAFTFAAGLDDDISGLALTRRDLGCLFHERIADTNLKLGA